MKDTGFRDDPRVRNFLYVGGGSILLDLLSTWKPFLGETHFDRAKILGLYGVSFVVVALLIIGATACSILLKCARTRWRHPQDYPDEPFHPVIDYLQYGYRFYVDQYREALDRRRRDVLTRLRGLSAQSATVLAANMLALDRFRNNPGATDRGTLTRPLLQAMCTIVRAYAQNSSQAVINANYMVAIPFSSATSDQKNRLRFSWGDPARYGYLLLLQEYAYPIGSEDFALPVEDPARAPHWADETLPGAPEAFLKQRELVVQTGRLDFAKNVPQNVREEIESYFRNKGFASFASLIIVGEGGPRGVVNIESSEEYIFQKATDIQNEVARLLQPFCTLLGLVLP